MIKKILNRFRLMGRLKRENDKLRRAIYDYHNAPPHARLWRYKEMLKIAGVPETLRGRM